MKRWTILAIFLLACGFALAGEDVAPAATSVEPDLAVCLLDDLAETAKGKPEPPPACCDPALEPGTNGNPFCFEGHTCCADGNWNCNQPDGSPSCSPGTVCGECASRGDSCAVNTDCCTGKCKGGRCR